MNSGSTVVFGANGVIGQACSDQLARNGHEVFRVTRERSIDGGTDLPLNWSHGLPAASVKAVVWAQGVNSSGTCLDSSDDQLSGVVQANVGFIASTARVLISRSLVAPNCRFVVISSIWQESARANKFEYVVSKAAVAGLVRSMAIDLAPRGISINAVLPGVVDTPMAREFLTAEQMDHVVAETPLGRLVSLDQVAAAVAWLASDQASGITGQFVTVDGGWSVFRSV